FNGDYKEKQIIDGKLCYNIDLYDIQIPVFDAVLEFIYTGNVATASKENNPERNDSYLSVWEHIYQAADYFGLEELLDASFWQITRELEDIDALRILLTWGVKYDEIKDFMVYQLSHNGVTPF